MFTYQIAVFLHRKGSLFWTNIPDSHNESGTAHKVYCHKSMTRRELCFVNISALHAHLLGARFPLNKNWSAPVSPHVITLTQAVNTRRYCIKFEVQGHFERQALRRKFRFSKVKRRFLDARRTTSRKSSFKKTVFNKIVLRITNGGHGQLMSTMTGNQDKKEFQHQFFITSSNKR